MCVFLDTIFIEVVYSRDGDCFVLVTLRTWPFIRFCVLVETQISSLCHESYLLEYVKWECARFWKNHMGRKIEYVVINTNLDIKIAQRCLTDIMMLQKAV